MIGEARFPDVRIWESGFFFCWFLPYTYCSNDAIARVLAFTQNENDNHSHSRGLIFSTTALDLQHVAKRGKVYLSVSKRHIASCTLQILDRFNLHWSFQHVLSSGKFTQCCSDWLETLVYPAASFDNSWALAKIIATPQGVAVQIFGFWAVVKIAGRSILSRSGKVTKSSFPLGTTYKAIQIHLS